MKLWRILCFITLLVFSLSSPIQALAFNPLASPNLGDPPAPPANFSKTDPTNGATGVSTTPTLSWEVSSQAFSYEYCYDQTSGTACDGTWTSTGSDTSVTLGTLSEGTYYWQVRAKNTEGTTEANTGTWWSFEVGSGSAPGPFDKIAPSNGMTNVITNPTLSWQSSSGAASYAYCIDTNNNNSCDGSWTSAGSSTSIVPAALNYNTVYYWQVKAINGGFETFANGGTWWSFTTQNAPPAAFGKTAPANGATGIPFSTTLTWGTSTGVEHYEYCIDTTNDTTCQAAWISTGTNTSVAISGLGANTTYYWQVKAVNSTGTTDANGGTWWSFTTQLATPGAFGKSTPTNNATSVSVSPTLSWGTSSGATSYEYCYDTNNNGGCDGTWTSTGANTSASLSGLSYSTDYYWQVRATNTAGTTEADGGSWWKFTTQIPPPAAFNKSDPASGATAVPTNPTLSWGTSTDAASYDYCIDTTIGSTCEGSWTSTATNTSVALSGLANNTTYYWQVRAVNTTGSTYANGDTWWSFTTQVAPPGAFGKTAPANNATNVSVNPTLSWGASSGAASYEYCYDTTNDTTCQGTWTSTGTNTSASLTGLAYNTPYYWHVRATNAAGTTYADSDTWWSFTTQIAPPGPFGKTAPTTGAADLPLNPTLSWEASDGAASYEYCYDTTNDTTCQGTWTSAGANTSVAISGLAYYTTYYWQVRAVNTTGTTEADSSAWWSFTTELPPPPGAFNKVSPADTATNTSIHPTLSWGTSTDATSYEYCYDTSNDTTCDTGWTSTSATSVALSNLEYETTYYWQVKAVNVTTTTEANGGSWWSFTTQVAPPAPFNKTSPTNGQVDVPLDPTLSWGASTGAESYEYCYDTTNNGTCDGEWTSAGTNTSVDLAGLGYLTYYYWQVKAVNITGSTDANNGTWWSFRTVPPPPPAAFSKVNPTDGSPSVSIQPTLTWQTSTYASSYQYCIDTSNNNSCDSSWQSTGANTSADLTGLTYSTTYYWQVQATNTTATVNANSGIWWSFTTEPLPLPGAFNKTAPANSATGVSINPTLSWETSSHAASYQYCIDTVNNDVCDGSYTSTGTSTSAGLTGLAYSTTYYWQAQAVNTSGTTDANGGIWWSFTTQGPPPGPFSKTSPTSGSTGLSITPTLTWGASSGATSYEYCYDTTNDTTCQGSWSSTGLTTNVTLSGLSYNTTYYWQVRAVNTSAETYANDGTWWSFTTLIAPPGAFNKTEPFNGATGVPINPTLKWETSAGVEHYEFCIDQTSGTTCQGTWTSTGTATSVNLSSLAYNTTYYWHVKAINSTGTTESNGGTWWSFITQGPPPAAFNKTAPANSATSVTINPTLTWETSSGATSYEYCIDTTNDTTCQGTWSSTGTSTSKSLSNLSYNTKYYWQIRAVNSTAYTYANGGTWWSFTTQIAPPAAFTKTAPASGATAVTVPAPLSWGASSGATSYEYCLDTTNDTTCQGTWTSTGTSTTANAGGLSYHTVYYWQVRAKNSVGTTEANSGAWWSFTTQYAPDSYEPDNSPGEAKDITSGAAQTHSIAPHTDLDWVKFTLTETSALVLQTSGSSGETRLSLYNSSLQLVEENIGGNGTFSKIDRVCGIDPLVAGTYYVKVEENGNNAEIENYSLTYTLTGACLGPDPFSKLSPANGSTDVLTQVTLIWQATTSANRYEVCFDTTNNDTCDKGWIDRGAATSYVATGLIKGTTYYWQARAVNAYGSTVADSGNWWSFKVKTDKIYYFIPMVSNEAGRD